MLKNSVIKNLQNIVGDNNSYLDDSKLADFSVDGLVPEIVVCPDSIEQLSEVMKLASKECLSVVPMGSGTKRALGNKPERADIVVSTKNLNKLVEHASSDLVATTEAGASLRDFQDELSKEKQMLALDPPHVDTGATIGGIIASNDSGPGRLRYGTAREFLIGLKVVQADGKIFRGGSKVVKNVAGYDLPKLYVGSLGTLGIIVEATFRLYPVPEYSETYLVSFSSLDDCHAVVMDLLGSDLVMTSLEIISPDLSSELAKRNGLDIKNDEHTIAICIKNVERAVKDQIATVRNICNQKSEKGFVISGNQELGLWNDIRNFPWQIASSQAVICKVSTLVTDIAKLLDNIHKIVKGNDINAYVSARAGNGICIVAMHGDAPSLLETLQALSSFASLLGGHILVQEAPSEIKSKINVWGEIGSGKTIMKRIKHNFDPNNILNPGRYI